MRNRVYFVLRLLIGIVLVCGPGAVAQPAAGELKLPVPRTFDLAHVKPTHYAVALGKDPVKIFAFVRDQIGYEVYTGVLRGPRGTLLAMAGNSVDQAALLGSLLKESGHRVRYVRGTLPRAEAKRLVDSMWAERVSGVPAGSPADMTEAANAAAYTLRAAVTRDFKLIQDQLKTAAPPAARERTVSVDALVLEAQAHYWVQWFKDGDWVDLDPSFRNATLGKAHGRAEATYEALPESLHHRVTLRIKLEEYPVPLDGKAEGSPTSRQILSYNVKAAELAGVDLVLTHQPEKWSAPAASLAAALASGISSSTRVKPVLVTGPEKWVSGAAFRLTPPASGGMGGLSDMLGGAGTRRPVPIATAESVELEFVDPSGRRVRVVREIFDVVGKARRASGENLNQQEVRERAAAAAAARVNQALYSLFFTTGHVAAAHVEGIADLAPRADTAPDVRSILRQIAIGFLVASDEMTRRMGQAERALVRFYPDSPRLLIVELGGGANKERLALDLRRDHARAVVSGPRADDVYAARVLRGVVNGTLERVWLEHVLGQSRERALSAAVSTSLLFERALAENVRPVLLPRDQNRLDAALPPDTAARLREEQASGQLALAPQRAIMVENAPRLAWWRIDPRSGETVAVSDEGLHVVEASLVRYEGTNTVEIVLRSVIGSTIRAGMTITVRSPAALAWVMRLLAALGVRIVSDITSSPIFH